MPLLFYIASKYLRLKVYVKSFYTKSRKLFHMKSVKISVAREIGRSKKVMTSLSMGCQ